MMKKIPSLVLSALLCAAFISGCKSSSPEAGPSSAPETSAQTSSSQADSQENPAQTSSQADEPDTPEPENNEEPDTDTSSGTPSGDNATLRIGSLKGPTSMGLVFLMEMAETGKAEQDYDFTMVTSADELLPKVINGDLDIALVPANVASVLYNRTEGQVSVIDINTLGVLYGVTADSSIQSMEDLKGKTVYMTGKGTTPDYVVQYLLEANEILDQVTLEFKSEPAEVAALLAQQPESIGILPQPFVTAACAQNEALNIVLDLTEEWENAQDQNGSQLVTGVTLVRNEFLEAHPQAVADFLKEHEKSADFTKDQPDQAAELIVKAGIIEKAPVAKKALPYCKITCITGQEMKDALSGYLNVLFERDENSIGGKLPGDDFYFCGQ